MREHVEEAINQNGQSGRRGVSCVKPRNERALPCAVDIRRVTLKSLGFSFDRAWMNALFLMPVALTQSSGALSDVLPRIYLVELSTCTLALALAALLLAIGKTTPHITSLINRHFLGGSLACAGVLLLIPSLIFAEFPSFAFVIIGLLTGLGEALLVLQWCDSFRGTKTLSIVGLGLAFLFGGVLSILISAIGFLPIRLGVIAAAPVASSFVLKKTAAFSEGGGKPEEMPLENWRSFKASYTVFLAKLITATILLSLILSSFRLLSGGDLFSQYYVFAPPLAGVICLFIAGACMLFSKHYEYKYVYRMVMTLVFAGSALLPVSHSEIFCDLMARTGLFCFELLFLPIAIGFSARSRRLALLSIAATEAAYMGAEMLGTLLVYYTPGAILSAFETIPLSILILVALFLIYTYILNEGSISDMEGWNEEIEVVSPAPQETAPKANPQEQRAAIIATAVNDLAKLHSLSPRETEVMVFLASGYSRAQIRDKLCISQGTINSHISRIYQKVGVHSRDELSYAVERHSDSKR